MSAIPQPTSSRFVSERILDPLRQVARRQWTVLATKGVIQTLLLSLTLILAAVLILGRFTNVPVWVRVPVALVVWGSVIGSAIYFVLRPALENRSLVRTALEVERQLRLTRDTQERISSSVELSAEKDPRFAGSPELIRHLVQQAEADAAAVDPKSLVPADKVVKLGLLLLPLLFLWVGLVWWLPRERILRPMYHLLMPWKSAPALLSHVVVQPGDVTLAQGDNLEILTLVREEGSAERDRRINHAALTVVDGSGQPVVHEMNRTGARDFRFAMEDLQKGFRYRVATDEGDSPEYTVTVNPRPAVEQLDLRYEFPHYTGMDPRVEANNENGAIDGLQGTKVTVVVHCSNNLKLPESRLVMTDRVQGVKPEPRDVPLQKAADGTYQAQIVLTNSAEYAIKLTNDLGLSNKDDQPHPITVRYDEKPTVAITWPQASMTVRPDDTVPVTFQATDDFGVSKVEAFVQVDGAAEPKAVEVKLRPGDRRLINDKYRLDVARVLSDAKLPDAQGLTYWLKATDNRDPDPQSAESARQTLKLARNAESVERQQDEKRAKDMEAAIRKAISEIDQEKPQANQYEWAEQNQSLGNDQKQNAENLKDKIEKTSSDLVAAADEHKDDSFADIAAKAREIAEKPILAAADDVSKVELHADSFESRKKDAHDAAVALAEARTRLEALLKKEEQQAKNVEAADQLKELAKDQQKLAEQQAKAQPNQQPDQGAQQQVAQQTQQAVSQAPALQNNEKARREAEKLAQLLNKLNEIEKKQQQQEQQVQKQAEAAELQQKANELAQKQEELNKKIEQFKKDDKAALEKAGAQAPSEQQEQNIVKELNQNQVQQANNEQNQAAQQLENAANQLQQKANDNNLQPNADQQAALNQGQQQAQQAQQDNQKAQQEGQQAQQAQQNAQNAQQAAQNAQKADNADQKKSATQQAAQQAAQAAQQAAEVAKQVEQQAKATEKQAEAAAQDGHADVQQAAQAAEQAAQQAEKSAQAAEQAAQQAQADAQAGDAPKAAQEAAEAAKDATQAAQQEQNAAQQLAQADNKEAEHAKGEMLQQQKDASAQAAAEAKELAQEQKALAQQAQANAQAAQQAQQGAQPPQQAASEQKQLAHETKQAAAQAEQLQQSAQQAGDQELAKRADAAQQELKQAQAAQEQAAAAEAGGMPDQAAGQQEKAENNLAQAEQALRGEAQADAGKPDAGKPDAGQADAGKPDAGKPDAGQDAGQDAGKPESGQGQAQAAEPHPGEAGQAQAQAEQAAANPQQAMQQAAEHAQEAIQAQQQAMQGQAQASQEAAQALAQAAQELAQATSPNGEPGQEQGQDQGQDPGQDPGKGQRQQKPSQVAGQATDPTMGLQAQANAASDGRPTSVQELGISASDWAKLGPLQQRELINAAQQSGPPGYQAMIKNYYIRLAHMQAQGATQR